MVDLIGELQDMPGLVHVYMVGSAGIDVAQIVDVAHVSVERHGLRCIDAGSL
jgi:hypothetical protein